MNILVTGGAGYIGSHICVELLESGYGVVALDNLCNSSPRAVAAIEAIAGRRVKFCEGDIRDAELLAHIFKENDIYGVIHMAGLKAVGESIEKPLAYFDNNISGSVCLLEAMAAAGVKRMIFSSSATVYGASEAQPLTEDMPPAEPANPYGRTKLMIEQILGDLTAADAQWSCVLLRYFNPVGAHPSGDMGENPRGVPNNLMPYMTQTALGKLEKLRIFGGDYPTPDGTCIRDYIHVVDLAKGHIAAIAKLAECGRHVYNLGTGRGVSVKEIVSAFEKANGITLPKEIVDRRAGDVPQNWADASRAARDLGFRATRTLEEMCRDSMRWQKKHPNGY